MKINSSEKVTQLNDRYRIATDGKQFILQEASNPEQTEWGNSTFHPTLRSVFHRLSLKETMENWGDFEAINKALREIRGMAELIDAKIKPY